MSWCARAVAPLALLALALGCGSPLDRFEGTPVGSLSKPAQRRVLALVDSLQSRRPAVVFLGDSITEGWRRDGRDIWEREFAPLGAMNLGVDGDRTRPLLWRLEHEHFEARAPRAAVLLIGTNDTNEAEVTGPELGERVLEVARAVRREWPRTALTVVALLPRDREPSPRRQKLLRANQILASAAALEGYNWMDVGDRFVDESGRIPAELMPDALHLSARGYAVLADSLLPWLHQVLAKAPPAGR